MNQKIPEQLFRNPEQKPDNILFKTVLDKNVFEVIKKINKAFSETNIDLEWIFYKDTKAWLGKATCKKKTIVWISVWENFIKASFYFTEKTRSLVLNLNFDEGKKDLFRNTKCIGKLIPLTFEIQSTQELPDFLEILNFKRKLK